MACRTGSGGAAPVFVFFCCAAAGIAQTNRSSVARPVIWDALERTREEFFIGALMALFQTTWLTLEECRPIPAEEAVGAGQFPSGVSALRFRRRAWPGPPQ